MKKLITTLQDAGQDHEFYPTTHEILAALFADMEKQDIRPGSVLDIGAGNGKVLDAFHKRAKERKDGWPTLYAIEKSTVLQQQLDASVLILGSDFAEQSLYSKPVDLVFCNPPYSDYQQWMRKILREAAASTIYLVVPRRWEDSAEVTAALKFRGILRPGEKDPMEPEEEDERAWRRFCNYAHSPRIHIVGEFDFADAEDRKARAKVHLLRVDLNKGKSDRAEGDAFERFFNEQFADLIAKYPKAEDGGRKAEGDEEKKPNRFPLVVGEDYAESLVALYLSEMANLERNYRLVGQLDAELLREFEISPAKIMELLKLRLSGLRHDYWHELFSRFDKITRRLTTGSRESLLKTLRANVEVDFTVGNIHAIVLWVLKNTNLYLESQFLDLYDKMVAHCNVVNYKSNQRTWKRAEWRYGQGRGEGNSHYALDYRIVMESVGGIATYEYDWDKRSNNYLKPECFTFLQDLLTVANNLGFQCSTAPYPLQRNAYTWQSNNKEEFYWHPASRQKGELLDGQPCPAELLFDARAFKNGNLHLRLNQKFILAMNVEHGRLKGWLRSPEEAVQELGDKAAAAHWKTTLALPTSQPMLLLAA